MNEFKTRIISEAVSLPFTTDADDALQIVRRRFRKALGGNITDYTFSIFRRSVDARKRDDIRFVYTVLVQSSAEEKIPEETIRKIEAIDGVFGVYVVK